MDLSVVPLVYHSNQARTKEDLIARGKLWEGYKWYRYKQYEDLAKGYFYLLEREVKFNIRVRIAIDTEAYNTFDPESEISVSGKLNGSLSND